eukprot:1547398-Pyramimonas_sp.AAC.1
MQFGVLQRPLWPESVRIELGPRNLSLPSFFSRIPTSSNGPRKLGGASLTTTIFGSAPWKVPSCELNRSLRPNGRPTSAAQWAP